MRKFIVVFSLLVLPFLVCAQKQIDVVYLTNGSVIKGTITEMVMNESITVQMDNGSLIKVKMSDVQKVEKEEAEERNKEAKKKLSKFWGKVSGVALEAAGEATEEALNERLSPSGEPSSSGTTRESTSQESTPTAKQTVKNRKGEVCFVNPNLVSRRVVLTNKSTGDALELLIGEARYGEKVKGCLHEIPIGVYECKVYTTFSLKLVEQFTIQVNAIKKDSVELNNNNQN